MNLNSELRAQFTMNLLFADPKIGSAARTFLSLASYDVFYFLDEDLLLSRVKENPPHLVLFEPGGLVSEPETFISNLKKINAEVMPVAVVTEAEFMTGTQKKWPVHDYVLKNDLLDEVLLQRLDHLCGALYLEYQNEDLLAEVESLKKATRPPPAALPATVIQQFELLGELESFQKARHVEDLFARAIEVLGKWMLHVVFFRYVPASNHFVPLFFSDLEDQEKVRWKPDLGVFNQMKTKTVGFKDHIQHFAQDPHILFPIESVEPEIPYGFFVVWKGLGEIADQKNEFARVRSLLILFEVFFRALSFARQNDEMAVIDRLTGLHLGRELLPYLEGEVSRARRGFAAVSLVSVSFDHLSEIEQSFGESQKNLLLKNFADLMKTTGRLHDRIFRTGDNEFALALPDCSHQSAAIRAERLRQLVETSSFRMNGIQASVSCGVSEFPHFVGGAEQLLTAAVESMKFIQQRGGNKVCLYQPKDEFTPEYQVAEST